MRTKLFGSTGLRVSELCLGTMTFGEAWGFGSPPSEAKEVYEAFVAAGGNFFDTACNYQGGASETILGELVGRDRERAVIATKFTLSTAPGDPNAWGNHRKNIRRSLEGSLARLRTDHVDVYQVHIWDNTVPIVEVMSALDDLVRAGKVLHAGISDTPAWAIAQGNTWATAHGRTAFTSVQMEWSLLERTIEHEIVPMTRAFALPILAWSPLAFGVLTGKFHDGTRGSKRGDWLAGYLGPRADAIVPVVRRIAEERGVSAARVALAWVHSRGPQVFPIVGARTRAQLVDNLGALEITLTPDELARLDEVSKPAPIFPGKMWAVPGRPDFWSAGTAANLVWDRPGS